MRINFTHRGNFNNLERFLAKATKSRTIIRMILHKYGKKGVEALAEATPKESGATAEGWDYKIEEDGSGCKIVWTNSHQNQGYTIALLLQYGHGTGTGGYVQGIDYINPAVAGIFQQMADEAWREVTS
jgi:hypothetical protein